MTLDSITITNFGAYKGTHTAALSPKKKQPIVLFGGMNGGGKTTLLDSLLLVLYGSRAKLSNRGSKSYLAYIKESIHRGVPLEEGAAISLEFTRRVEGETFNYRLTRKWNNKGKRLKESLTVLINEELDKNQTAQWDDVIDSYLPVGVSHLFFFDGEQIKDLADGRHASEILGTAVNSLLGLDLVDRLEADLKLFERKKKKQGMDKEALKAYKEAELNLQLSESALEASVQEGGKLTNALVVAEKALKNAELKFRKEGGDLYIRHKELDNDIVTLRHKKHDCEGQLRALASGILPLGLIQPLLTEIKCQSESEEEALQLEFLNSKIKERDRNLLIDLKNEKVPNDILKLLKSKFSNDAKKRQKHQHTDILLGASRQLSSKVETLLTVTLPQQEQQLQVMACLLADLEEQIAQGEGLLAKVPEDYKIASFQNALDQTSKEHSEIEIQQKAHQMLQDSCIRKLGEAKNRLERLAHEEVNARLNEDARQRMLVHASRVRETLGKFRIKVVRKHVSKLENLILESFQSLIRKADFVYRLTIDPVSFVITLFNRNGEIIAFERLSAGERQLLATSILWGLARATGRPIPTVIDTPLGRLDSEHRKHLIERYFPTASHQVILLSTDEEIMGGHYRSLEPLCAQKYLLNYDSKTGSTTIVDGYFQQ